jgi:hypothetical protein
MCLDPVAGGLADGDAALPVAAGDGHKTGTWAAKIKCMTVTGQNGAVKGYPSHVAPLG